MSISNSPIPDPVIIPPTVMRHFARDELLVKALAFVEDRSKEFGRTRENFHEQLGVLTDFVLDLYAEDKSQSIRPE